MRLLALPGLAALFLLSGCGGESGTTELPNYVSSLLESSSSVAINSWPTPVAAFGYSPTGGAPRVNGGSTPREAVRWSAVFSFETIPNPYGGNRAELLTGTPNFYGGYGTDLNGVEKPITNVPGIVDLIDATGTRAARIEAMIQGNTSAGVRVDSPTVARVFRASGDGASIVFFNNPTGFRPAKVRAMNAAGLVVGTGARENLARAFVASGTEVVELGDGTAEAINANGTIVGWDAAGPWVRQSPTAGRRGLPLLPGATRGEALAVNARGDVVGFNLVDGVEVPVLWFQANGALLDLRARTTPVTGVVLERAFAISDDGVIRIAGNRAGKRLAVTLFPPMP